MEENKGITQYEKYTPEELNKVLLFLDGQVDTKDLGDLIKDPEARERLDELNRRADEKSPSDLPAEYVIESVVILFDEMAKHIDKKDFIKLSSIKSDNSKFLEAILMHPEYYEGGLGTEDVLVLMASQRNNIRSLNYFTNEPVGQFYRALSYTQDEKDATRIYTGEAPYRTERRVIRYIYELYNMLFYPGLKNESARMFEEAKIPPTETLEDMKELLSFSRTFYKAIYKGSRKLPETLEINRVDRVATIEMMEDTGEIMSNFSATLGRPNGMFSKRHTALIEGIVHRGIVGADFEEMLKGLYQYREEKELFVSPGAKVKIEDMALTDEEKSIAQYDEDTVDRKIRIEIFADSNHIDPLTKEEEREKYELEDYLLDRRNAKRAADFVENLGNIRISHSIPVELPPGKKKSKPVTEPSISFDEAIALIDPELVKHYLEFKAKFRRYYDLMTREVAMEVESSLERAEYNFRRGEMESSKELIEYGEKHPKTDRFVRQGIVYRDEMARSEQEGESYINSDEIEEMVREEKTQDIHSAVDTFGKIVGDKDILITPEDGIEKR